MQERPLSMLTHIVVHHTDTPEHFSVEQVRQIHMNLTPPYADVGYHFLVGQVRLQSSKGMLSIGYEAQVGRALKYRGAHAAGDKRPELGDVNSIAIGIALIGNFCEKDPSPKMLNEVAYIVKVLCKRYGIKMDRNHILGHKDVDATACPGTNTMKMLYAKLGI